MKNRIYNQLDLNQPEEQASFRQNYTTVDHLHILNQVMEKAKEYKIELHWYSWISERLLTQLSTLKYGKR